MFIWLITPIIGYFMWHKNLRSQDGRVKVKSLTWPQFWLLILVWAIGVFLLSLIPPFNMERIFFNNLASLFVGTILIEILIILRYRSLWSILLLINVFFPMLLWIIAGYSDSYNYPGGRGGGFTVVFMYFYWLMESGSLYAKMWLLKFVIYMYGSFLWEEADKQQDKEDIIYKDGDDVNTKDSTNMTFLMRASQNGDFEDVKFFVEEGADINAQDNESHTALTCAAFFGHLEVVKYFIDNGADLNVKDRVGETALDMALEQEYTDIVKLLRDAGATE